MIQSKLRCSVLGLTGAVALSGLTAKAESGKTVYADLSVVGAVSYTLEDGTSVSGPSAGDDLIVTKLIDRNTTPGFDWKINSLVFDAPRAGNFWIDGGVVSVGAGGVTFRQNTLWKVGRSSETDRRFRLTANQEWRGTETDPGDFSRATLSIGATYGGYYRMGLGVTEGVTQLTMSRYLDAVFMGQNTQMGDLDVTVKTPARLQVVYQYGNPAAVIDARLGCHSLTLEGDGDALTLGRRGAENRYMTTALDAAHFAPVLNLTDGADLTMNTSYLSVGTFAIPTVNVTKPAEATSDGVSAISGAFVVTQALTTVTLTGNPTFDLTGATLTEGETAAGWSITGPGTVKFSGPGYGLTGPFALGAETTVSFDGAVDLSALTFSSEASATLVMDPGEGCESVLGGIADFAGTIRLRSGQVVFAQGVGAATVIEEGGRAVHSEGLIVTDEIRAESEITVAAGQTLQVYGNGLTAATSVILDGGSLDFRSDGVTVASPITVTKSSYIRSGDLGTTNVISGFVTCDIQGEKGNLSVDGYGCVTFAGGMKAVMPEDPEWWKDAYGSYNTLVICGGAAELTNGDYDMGVGPIHLNGSDATWWGKYLGIRDGATVHFADRKNAQGSARNCIVINPPRDGAYYDRYKSRLEIGAGGTVTLPWNSTIIVGANQSYAELVVSGGELSFAPHAGMRLGDGSLSTGDFQLRGGTVTLNAPIRRLYESDQNRLLWYGGTIRLGSNFGAETLFADSNYGDMTKLHSCCQILGDGCVLDLGACSLASVANVPAGREFGEWIGTGTLTVVGGTTCKELVMNTFPGNVKLQLRNGVQVTIPEGARVYDAAKSNFAWKRPDNGYSGTTETWQTGGDVRLGELQLADDSRVCVSNAISAKTITVDTVRVLEGASFNASNRYLKAATTSFTDFVFDPGSTWEITDRTQLVLPGTLALPSDAEGLTANLQGVACPFVPATAAGGVTGSVDWLFARSPRRVTLLPKENPTAVQLDSLGLVLLFR